MTESASYAQARADRKPQYNQPHAAGRWQRFYLAVCRYRSDRMPHLRYRAIMTANQQGREADFIVNFRQEKRTGFGGATCA